MYVGVIMVFEIIVVVMGKVGVVCCDLMVMFLFCGYNMVDYFVYWFEMGKKILNLLRIFYVNWFR